MYIYTYVYGTASGIEYIIILNVYNTHLNARSESAYRRYIHTLTYIIHIMCLLYYVRIKLYCILCVFTSMRV